VRAIVIAIALARATQAHADPSNKQLVYVGLGLAVPTYVAGVALHESSHALAAVIVGAKVEKLHVFPPGIDPQAHVFRFGWTYVRGLRTRGQEVFFYAAPKLVDLALLGGFAALALTSAWPHDRYGQLALTVGATGLWVDFAKDVVLFAPTNDVVQVLDLWCMRGWRQVPARLVYAAAAVGLAVIVARGYERTFATPAPVATPLVVPLVHAAF
jgi:hypothetical protein